jgi:hypothetical protein
MKLQKFRITNYRSIHDSGWVNVGHRTVLVGRNESGKSNLLLALRSLRAQGDPVRFLLARDFPGDRSPAEWSKDLPVVRTVWALAESDRRALASCSPKAGRATHIEVGRGYEPGCWVRLLTSNDPDADVELDAAPLETPDRVAGRKRAAAEPEEDLALDTEDRLPEAPLAVDEPGDPDTDKAASDWVMRHLPAFLYLDEHPDIPGHQNLVEFLKRQKGKELLASDHRFEKLMRVSGLDPRAVDTLLTSDPDTRRRIVNHAGRQLTRKLRELWSDRPLKVRFDLDGEHFNTLVSDPNSLYDVEVNLDERSRGFRWFFSFYVSFAAEAGEPDAQPIILLLDEPGLHLHARGQRDLLEHLARDFRNPVLLTTQSPFLVPTDDLASVRTVEISEEEGTRVSNGLSGDARTLFPVVHALGARLVNELLEPGPHLVVGTLSEYWVLQAAASALREAGATSLPPELTITPAGGAAGVVALTALLSSQGISSLVLRSGDPSGDPRVRAGLGESGGLVFVADALDRERSSGADVEDLLDEKIYDQFVRLAYKTVLENRPFEPDPAQPRLVRRYEKVFTALGVPFSRDRVARLLLRAIAQNPAAVFPPESRTRFERLFRAVRGRLDGA